MLMCMQDSRAPEASIREFIVVPSRGDPFLRTMTESVGGPLGRRTAPVFNGLLVSVPQFFSGRQTGHLAPIFQPELSL